MATLSIGHTTREIFGSPEHRGFLLRRIWNAAERVRTPLVLGAEMMLGAVSYTLAVWALAENRGTSWTSDVLAATLGIVVLGRLTAALSVRLHLRSLRYASLAELISIIKVATRFSSIGMCALIWWRFPELKVRRRQRSWLTGHSCCFSGVVSISARAYSKHNRLYRAQGESAW